MAKSGWDIPPSELTAFVVQQHKDLLQKASIRLLRGVVLRSPVDTGRFRANWQVSQGQLRQGVVADFNAGKQGSTKAAVTRQSLGKGTKEILASGKEFPVYYVTNNLPYAQRLENGWSDQAPRGMVALSLTEVIKWLNNQ